MKNTADVTGSKPIAVLLQSISGVSAIYPLAAFYYICSIAKKEQNLLGRELVSGAEIKPPVFQNEDIHLLDLMTIYNRRQQTIPRFRRLTTPSAIHIWNYC
jgi:hypothetical protein